MKVCVQYVSAVALQTWLDAVQQVPDTHSWLAPSVPRRGAGGVGSSLHGASGALPGGLHLAAGPIHTDALHHYPSPLDH
jgi:hypothetical protein